MSKSSLVKRMTAAVASAATTLKVPSGETAEPERTEQNYIELRAKQIFQELYPNEEPGNYPRALWAITKGLRDVEVDAITAADGFMFQKGVEEAKHQILAIVKDPASCIDPVTRQPTASHFDWRNVTLLLAERISALKISPPGKGA